MSRLVAMSCAVFLCCLAARSQNILRNATFTQCTNPRIPDYWGSGAPEWVDGWAEGYGVEDDAPVPGCKSLKVTNPEQQPTHWWRVQSHGMPVTIQLGPATKTFRLTTEWKRYSLTDTAKSFGRGLVLAFRTTEKGVFWIAAPQVEQSETASPFAPAPAAPADQPKQAAQRERLTIARSEGAKIDGRLDDACWHRAMASGTGRAAPFVGLAAPTPAKVQTEAFVTYDDEAMYVAFRCNEPELSRLVVSGDRRDASLFSGDCVEVFLDTGAGRPYYHFAVNPAGVQYDEQGYEPGWDAEWDAAAGREPGAWTAEVRIPFSSIRLGPDVSAYRINLCRHRKAGAEEWSSWSCTYGGFHSPDRFGRLSGLDAAAVARHGYLIELRRLEHVGERARLDATISSWAPSRGPVRISLDVRVPSGDSVRREWKAHVGADPAPLAPAEFTFPARAGMYAVSVSVLDAASGELLHRESARLTLPGAGRMETFRAMLDKSYYTTEPIARLLVSPASGEPTRVVAMLRSSTGQRRLLDALLAPHERKVFEFNIRDLPVGDHDVVVRVTLSGRERIGLWRGVLRKLSSNPVEVKINRFTQTLERDGEFVLPYAMGLHSGFRLDRLDDIADHHFNAIVCIVPSFDSEDAFEAREGEIRRILDEAWRRDLYVVVWNSIPRDWPYEKVEEAVVRNVRNLKDHPAVLGWYLLDEPEGWWEQSGGNKRERDLVRLREEAAAADPYRPCFINWYRWVPGRTGYGTLDATDIGSLDRYPIGRNNGMKAMADIVRIMQNDCAPTGKPVNIWLQIYGYDDAVREPTPAEQRCQTYLSLIEGARSIYYFIYKPMSIEMWDSMRPLGDELSTLAPVFASGASATDRVRVSDERIRFAAFYCGERREKRRCRGACRASGRGRRLCVIAANAGYDEVSATFDLRGAIGRRVRTARVLFENRTVSCTNGKLTDTFRGPDRHVYVFEPEGR
ncbi:MAG: carbohydrate binding family 9 domain-containing protein [Armatimonadota bacterium]